MTKLTPHTAATGGTHPLRHLAGVDGLRGIAALSVLLFHVQRAFNPSTRNLPILNEIPFLTHGVTLFFVLSGFLLYLPYARHLLGFAPRPSTSIYLRNRALRIFPAYLTVLLVTTLVLREAWLPKTAAGGGPHIGMLSAPDTLVAALLLQNFTPRTIRSGLEVAWTLGVEMTFYLVLPLLVAAAHTYQHRQTSPLRSALLPAGILCLVGIGGKLWLAYAEIGMNSGDRVNFEWGQTWSAVIARSILIHGDLFAYGMVAAILFAVVAHHPAWLKVVRGCRPVLLTSAAVIAVGVVAGSISGPFTTSALALACAALILATASAPASAPLARFTDSSLLRMAGRISFGIYLWHFPIIHWLYDRDLYFSDTPWGFLANLALVGVPTVTLAAVTFYIIEKPALRLKRRGTAWGIG